MRPSLHWVAMTTGKMNPMRAFMSGKIKVDGDIKLAVNLPTVVNMVEGYGIGMQGPIAIIRTGIENTVARLRRPLPSISPMPPRTTGALPWIRAGRRLLRNPTAFFTECRAEMGDTFIVDAFGYRLFCVFSAAGVRSLWALPEAIRMTQRSIVLRRVVTPIDFEDGSETRRLPPGTLVTTMMSVTNTTAAPWLAKFDISNYRGSVFPRSKKLAAPELVTTYGHGKHTCPAHRFSTSAITQAISELVRRFNLEPRYKDPNPRPRQLGGVARADRTCKIAYTRR